MKTQIMIVTPGGEGVRQEILGAFNKEETAEEVLTLAGWRYEKKYGQDPRGNQYVIYELRWHPKVHNPSKEWREACK